MEVFSCKNATNNVSVRSSIFELFDLNDGHLENRTREIIITRSIKNGCFAGKKMLPTHKTKSISYKSNPGIKIYILSFETIYIHILEILNSFLHFWGHHSLSSHP